MAVLALAFALWIPAYAWAATLDYAYVQYRMPGGDVASGAFYRTESVITCRLDAPTDRITLEIADLFFQSELATTDGSLRINGVTCRTISTSMLLHLDEPVSINLDTGITQVEVGVLGTGDGEADATRLYLAFEQPEAQGDVGAAADQQPMPEIAYDPRSILLPR